MTTADRRSQSEHGNNGPTVGQIVAKKYRIDRILGEGGMGRVFAAENLRTGKMVALKYVLARDGSEAAMERFAREARAAGRIHHPGVIDIYDVVEDEAGTCLVMELLKGESLRALMDRGTLSIADTVGIIIATARGVTAAHEAGVIHRDLKPDNIFLCSSGGEVRVKVLDFGVSKLAGQAAERGITKTGAVVGTPHYMAPEQVRGMTDIDHRIDVYALSAVLYEMLTGKPPLDHEKMTALLVLIATEEPPPIDTQRSDLPEGLSKVVMRGLAKDRDERFQSAAELARALEPFGDGTRFDSSDAREWTKRISTDEQAAVDLSASHASTIAARVSGERPRAMDTSPVPPPPQKTAPLLALAGAAILLALGVIGWILASDPEPSEVSGDAAETAPASVETAAADAGEEPHETAAPAPPASELDAGSGDTSSSDTVLDDAGPGDTVLDDAGPSRGRSGSRRGRRSRRRSSTQTSEPRAGSISVDDF